jgi:Cu(I)/Ag(I) efflux system membrane fusion protein
VSKNLRATSLLLAGLVVAGTIVGVLARSRPRSNVTEAAPVASASSKQNRVPVVLDQRRQQISGVRTTPVVRDTLSAGLRAFGVVAYDASGLTDFNLKLDGWVKDVFVTATGQRVRKGDALFTLTSQELTGAQLQYLAALRSLQQLSPAQLADREYQERLIETPRQRLLFWDVPLDQLRALQEKGAALDAITFRAPSDGLIVEQSVVKGMRVETGETLYKIANTSMVWIEADFNSSEVDHVPEHASATIIVDASGDRLTGRILNQFPGVSPQTRTTKVRLEVPNPQSRLKPGMFATVEVRTEPVTGLVIPEDALLDSGSRQTVFVAKGDGYFEPRGVVAAMHANSRVLIISGLQEGEQVVARGAFLVDSESQLRTALQQYEESPAGPTTSAPAPRMTVQFGNGSEEPRATDTSVRVDLHDANGTAVTDATLDVQFYMAPMPSMNMAAMTSHLRLTHVGGGTYQGSGSLSMAGRWDVTIAATRGGVRFATQRTSLVAR